MEIENSPVTQSVDKGKAKIQTMDVDPSAGSRKTSAESLPWYLSIVSIVAFATYYVT